MIDWLKKNSKYVSVFLLGVALIVVYKTFDNLKNIFSVFGIIFSAIKPFIIAFVIAYLLNIPASKLDAKIKKRARNMWVLKHSYGVSVAVVYSVFLLCLVIIAGSLIPALYKNLLQMYNNLPVFIDTVLAAVSHMPGFDSLGGEISSVNILSKIYESIDIASLGKYASGLMSFTSQIMSIVIALIASIYALLDKDRIINSIHRLADIFWSKDRSDSFFDGASSVNRIFTKYLYSRFICCVVMAIVSTFVLGIMREPYALILGIFIGFMDLIPYFGSIISWIVSAVIMAVSGGVLHSVWCSAAMLFLQILDGNVLAPKVMGDHLEIRPLLVIVSVSVGGTLFGFLGMLLSVPVVAVIRAIASEYVLAKAKSIRKDSDENEYPEDDEADEYEADEYE